MGANKRAWRRAILTAAVVGAIGPRARAADVSSTYIVPNGLWSSVGNWANNPAVLQYPNDGNGGFTYDATLTTGQALLTELITVEALTLGGNATINASGFALQANKMFTWTGGTLAGPGITSADGGINISDGAVKTLQQTLVNAATATWTGSDGVLGSGTVQNLVGATFDCQNNGLSGGAFGVAGFANQGTLIKSAGTQTAFSGGTFFNNTGTVQVNSGLSLQFNGQVAQFDTGTNTLTGGTWYVAGELLFPTGSINSNQGNVTLDGSSSAFTAINSLASNSGTFTITNGRNFAPTGSLANSGSIQIGTGSTLTMFGTATHTGSFNVMTGGTLLLSGGTQTFDTPASISGGGTVRVDGATLNGTANLATAGTLEVDSGAISGSGTFTILAGGTLRLVGSQAKALNRTINNFGTGSWNGSGGISGTGTFNNQSGGTFTILAGGMAPAWATAAFNNAGTLLKPFSGPSQFTTAFSNTGTVEVDQGTLQISGSIAEATTSTLTAGTWNVFNTGTLTISSPNLTTIGSAAAVSLGGSSSSFLKINTLADNQGSFTITGGRTFTTLGALANSGTLTIGLSSQLKLAGVMHDTATLSIDSTAKLDIADQKLITVQAAGSWNGSAYTGVTGLIQSGRNGGGWGGNGIITSQSPAATGNFTSIGVATASQVKGIGATQTSVWAGQTVTGSNTLVMYTYGGDANLDGKINVDDYGRIDFNVNLGTSGWFNGDFNYDGKINVDDYGIIDFNVGIQGAPFSTASGVSGGLSAVPEPSIGALFVLAALRRRRRRENVPRGTFP